jgi:hypothetical protein
VPAVAEGDERSSRLPDGSEKEALQDDTALAHGDPPDTPGFERLDEVRDRINVWIDERE